MSFILQKNAFSSSFVIWQQSEIFKIFFILVSISTCGPSKIEAVNLRESWIVTHLFLKVDRNQILYNVKLSVNLW